MRENVLGFETPSVTVDILVFTFQDSELRILLVRRLFEPFKDKWAIPGGFIKRGEELEDAAMRELEEETGVKNVYLEQLYTYGDPKRDPRGRVITVAYMALLRSANVRLKAASDVAEARWFSTRKLPVLAFDHRKIVDYSLKRLRWKFEYTPVAFSMLPSVFTMSELRGMYEVVFGKPFDKRNFTKKVLSLGILNEEGIKKEVSHRPPTLYSLRKDAGEFVGMV